MAFLLKAEFASLNNLSGDPVSTLNSSILFVVQRGRNETFVLTKEEYLEPDDDFYRAISIEDFAKGAKKHISKLYAQDKV